MKNDLKILLLLFALLLILFLTLQTPESFFARFRVDIRVRHEVTAIHRDRKTVSVTNLTTGETFEESYDKLLLAPGAKPVQPKLPGIGLDKVVAQVLEEMKK